MRKGLLRLTTVLTVLAAGTLVPAAEERRNKAQDPQTAHPGIASVTDANGNQVPLRENEVAVANTSALHMQPQGIQRGQAWWPYASAQPPYNAVGKRAEAMSADEIQVNGVALLNIRDVESTLRLLPRDLKLADGVQLARPEGYFLVKIAGFSRTQEQIDSLTKAGAVLGEYLNINTYVAKIPSASLSAVKSLPFVTFVGDYHPAYKISPRIGLEEIPENEAVDAATGKMKPWVFEVMLHTGADLKQALDGLRQLGIFPERRDIVSNDDLTTVLVRATPETVLSIAQVPEVKWIAEKTFAHLMASSTSPATIPMVLQNNGVFTTTKALGWKLWNAGIDGSLTNQIVTLEDTGLNTNMEHFSQNTTTAGTIGPAHRKVVGYDVDGGDQCVLAISGADEGHGTWTSQHAVGSISNMSPPDAVNTPPENWDDGIARGAKVYFRDIGDSTGAIFPSGDLGPGISTAITKGSFIENNSWGTASNIYDTEASNLDAALFSNPNFVVTVSAGNRGAVGGSTIGSPSTAKNCICVGGNDVANPNNLFIDCNWDGLAACSTNDLGSSRGPVAGSGRVKPDIMTYVYSSAAIGGEQEAIDEPRAMCQTDATKTVYFQWVNGHGFGGTSFAAPEVAGLAALVRDYFMQGFYPSGTATPADALTPSGALVKAVILASGEDMAAASFPTNQVIAKRYSNDVGYGRANVPGVLHIGSGAPFLWVQNNDLLGQAATKSFFFNINGNAIPLRVMLSWYDAANAPTGTIVKDANLRVTVGGTTVYLGNSFSGGWSTTGGVADTTNNTEGVFLDAAHGLPASGQVQVDVIGVNDPGGMNYSLVVSGNVASTSVQQVSLDKGQYTCGGPIKITVNDALATSPVSVTLVSKDSLSTVIDTKIVSCSGSGGVFNGTILAGSGITVVHGGSLTATYGAAAPANATFACQAALASAGFIIGGGCDNTAAGIDDATGPLTNGGVNEFYHKYFDAGEYSTYTVGFVNNTGSALTDVYVALGFSGTGASKMSALNGPIHVGAVAAGATAGAVFQLFTDPSATGVAFPTTVSLDFTFTSPGDGYTTPTLFSQVQQLQSNDVITREQRCSTFNTLLAFQAWTESGVTLNGGTGVLNWKWSGSATSPATVSSENRIDGICNDSTANAASMVGNSAITAGNNFAAGADSMLLQNFQPLITGNGPNGQPYHYVWKWHSFYHASETLGATTGVWGIFYNDKWNNPVNPTGDEVAAFTNNLSYFYQTIFDYVGTWNWDTANGGTPDNPNSGSPAPNQLFITFNNVTGLATPTTYFAYGHEHADLKVFGGVSSLTSRRDIAFDNDNLVYDEYYTAAQAAACTPGTQVGQVAFDQFSYGSCPSGSAVLSVVDTNAGGSVQVTVSSPGTLDTELVTLSLVSGVLYSGTVNFSTVSGIGANNGTLFVLPTETISVSYTDTSPVGTSTATAAIACAGGDVVYVTNTQVSDNGDNDGLPDNNECVTMDITIQNNLATPLTNTKVTIFSNSATVDSIADDHALYGTVGAGSSATNPGSDRFTFHVAPSVACTDPANPPTAKFTVVITADGLNGAALLQTFTINLDLNVGAGTTSYTQNFNVDPGWTTGVTAPDNAGCSANPYANDFHWCALCGNGSGGYGAWVGNAAFGTAGQNYTSPWNSSTLYSPVFIAGGASVSLQFRTQYRTELTFDGAIVQYQIGAGAWTTLPYSTPAQAATTTNAAFCSPILVSTQAWTGTATGTTSTVTNAASVATTNGQKIGFRWRLGGDSGVNGTTFGGFGVDDVTVTGLRVFLCEPNRNTGLVPCTFCSLNVNGTPCDDGNACTQSDSCQAGVCVGANPVACSALDQCHDAGVCNTGTGVCSNPAKTDGSACNDGNGCTAPDVCTAGACGGAPITVPPETQGVNASADKATYTWSPIPNATSYDVVRGDLGLLAVGPGGGDEVCFPNLPGATLSDATTPSVGTGVFYLSRCKNTCGTGTYGNQGVNGSPGAPRVTTTCP